MNCVKFLRSTTGRRVLEPPLTEQEATTLFAMEQQVVHIKRQFFALASRSAKRKRSPEELMADGRWPYGGMQELQLACRTRAARLSATVTRVQQLKGKSAAQLTLARKLSGSLVTMLLTALPPQRPKSLYSSRFLGVSGIEDPARACISCPAGTECRGNVLKREQPRVYRWILTHHKNEKTKTIPDQELSEAASTDPVLLDVLEDVGAHTHTLTRLLVTDTRFSEDPPKRLSTPCIEPLRGMAYMDARRCSRGGTCCTWRASDSWERSPSTRRSAELTEPRLTQQLAWVLSSRASCRRRWARRG